PRAHSLRTVPRTFSVSSSNLLSDGPRAEIDQKLRAARNQEKEEIKGLNNKFSDVIMRVRGQHIPTALSYPNSPN
ncbi:hypothetical protein chiPu_0024602, partial [Chiloscyllium punctatum]|nr:hypothetical protein [Chiloscyllium punctatum]